METLKNLASQNPTVSYCVGGTATVIVLYTVKDLFWKLALRLIVQDKTSITDVPPGTVILHQVRRGTRCPSLSPFPLKLETFLRLANIPYVNDLSGAQSSKGKTPWMTLDGVDVADSQLCIKYLKNKLNLDVNSKLTKEQQGVSQAIQVMVDEHLYWTLVYNRWVYDKKKTLVKRHFNPPAPILWMITRMVKKQLHGQGMGRHTDEEVWSFMLDDLSALNNYLADKAFMMGAELTEVDCSVFGMLCQFVYMQEDDVCKGMVQDKFPKLYAYVERIKDSLWPDWNDICTEGAHLKQE